jgi:hypothetical protein
MFTHRIATDRDNRPQADMLLVPDGLSPCPSLLLFIRQTSWMCMERCTKIFRRAGGFVYSGRYKYRFIPSDRDTPSTKAVGPIHDQVYPFEDCKNLSPGGRSNICAGSNMYVSRFTTCAPSAQCFSSSLPLRVPFRPRNPTMTLHMMRMLP